MENSQSVNGLYIRTYNQQATGHRHPYDQLTIPLKGRIEMVMNRTALTVSYGEAVYIPKFTYHQFKAKEDFRFLVVNLESEDSDSLQMANNSHTNATLNVKHRFSLDEKTLLFVNFIEKQLTSDGNEHIESLMMQLLNELLSTPKSHINIDPRIISVMNVINNNISAPHTIRTLADIACLSQSQFKVIFKQQLGCTAYEYITELRMQKALGLILNTDLPLSLVAEKCGYKSVSAFIRRFQNRYQQTPNKIRTCSKRSRG